MYMTLLKGECMNQALILTEGCGKCLRTKRTGQNSDFIAAGLVRTSLKRRARMSNPHDRRSPRVTFLQKVGRGWNPKAEGPLDPLAHVPI